MNVLKLGLLLVRTPIYQNEFQRQTQVKVQDEVNNRKNGLFKIAPGASKQSSRWYFLSKQNHKRVTVLGGQQSWSCLERNKQVSFIQKEKNYVLHSSIQNVSIKSRQLSNLNQEGYIERDCCIKWSEKTSLRITQVCNVHWNVDNQMNRPISHYKVWFRQSEISDLDSHDGPQNGARVVRRFSENSIVLCLPPQPSLHSWLFLDKNNQDKPRCSEHR